MTDLDRYFGLRDDCLGRRGVPGLERFQRRVLGPLLVAGVIAVLLCGVSRGDERATLLSQRIRILLQGIGLDYVVTAEPTLSGDRVPAGLQVRSVDTVFNVIFPALGLSYDMLGPKHLHLKSRQAAWLRLQPERNLPKESEPLRRRITLDPVSPARTAKRLGEVYGLPVLLDSRLAARGALRQQIEADSLADALAGLQRSEDWEWFTVEGILVLLPSAEDQVRQAPNRAGQRWIYADTPLADVLTQLGEVFRIEIDCSETLVDRPITGTLKGDTLGVLLNTLAGWLETSFQIESGRVVFGGESQEPVESFTAAEVEVGFRITILEVPQKRWEELKVTKFLTRVPQSETKEQEAFWNKVARSSGTKVFGQRDVSVANGSEIEVVFPLAGAEDAAPDSAASRTGYFFQLLPTVVERDWVRIALATRFRDQRDERRRRNPLLNSLFGDQPIQGELLIQNGAIQLIHGASRSRGKESTLFLIAMRPTIRPSRSD